MSSIASEYESYTKRILDLLGRQDPLEVQRKTVARLRRAMRDLSRKHLRWNPAPGKWSITQIISHLADTDLVYGYRIRKILSDPGGTIEPFDQDIWARNLKYEEHSVERDLDSLDALRKMNLEFYGRLSSEEWQRIGMHGQFGPLSIERICKLIAGHDLNHLGQVERLGRQLRQGAR